MVWYNKACLELIKFTVMFLLLTVWLGAVKNFVDSTMD